MPQTRPSAIRSRARLLKYTQNRILIPWVVKYTLLKLQYIENKHRKTRNPQKDKQTHGNNGF